ALAAVRPRTSRRCSHPTSSPCSGRATSRTSSAPPTAAPTAAAGHVRRPTAGRPATAPPRRPPRGGRPSAPGSRVGDTVRRDPVDQPRIAAAVREILLAIGEDPDRDGLQDTPDRVGRMYAEIFAGIGVDPCEVLTTVFEAEHDEMVLVRDIALASTCEHHLVPWIGQAHIGY